MIFGDPWLSTCGLYAAEPLPYQDYIWAITTAQDFDAPASMAALDKYEIKFAFLPGVLFEDRLNC